MRVISGTARGHKLLAPEGLQTRPTADRIKESLFSVISFILQDSIFLDVFCGSGAIGIEALSRGASKAVFIDNAKIACEATKANLFHTKLIDKSDIFCMDYLQSFEKLYKDGVKFDIIFMDPPYNKYLAEAALESIKKCGLVAQNGFVIVEQAADEDIISISGFELYKLKEYNTTKILFYKELEIL